MNAETRIDIIGDLIKRGNDLLEKPYSSPTIKLWKDDVVRFLEDVYDERLVEIFHDSFFTGRIIEHGAEQEDHEETMRNALEFLEGLKGKQPPEKPLNTVGRMMELKKKYDRSEHSSHHSAGYSTRESQIAYHTTISPIISPQFHNNNQQTVNVFIDELQSRIEERLPQTSNTEEKTFLTKLKASLNPTLTFFQVINLVIDIAKDIWPHTPTAAHHIQTLLANAPLA